MTTNRAYRPQLPVPRAIDELRRCAGVHFDARVVEAFLSAFGGGSQLPLT
jgi:HD-GYP domain-containing protein (c-di-GMP phosphodiesterase class II)